MGILLNSRRMLQFLAMLILIQVIVATNAHCADFGSNSAKSKYNSTTSKEINTSDSLRMFPWMGRTFLARYSRQGLLFRIMAERNRIGAGR
jgi:hypothetical protein